MRVFRELRLMVASVAGSMKSMFWALVVILFITYLFGLAFVQAAALALQGDRLSPKAKEGIAKYWCSVPTAMLSLYKASTSGDSWTYIAEPLHSVGFAFYVLFLLYIAFFLFVLTSTLTSIIVESTISNAEKDQQEMIHLELAKKHDYIKQIKRLYKKMDADGSGDISMDEFSAFLGEPAMLAFMGGLDIDASDVVQFFTIL